MYKITDKDKAWVEEAHLKGFTVLEMIKKLKESKASVEKVDAFTDYLMKFEENLNSLELPKLDDEKKFKQQVEDYKQGKEMGFWERREVKKWLKNMKKLLDTLKVTMIAIKKEYEYIIKDIDKKGLKVDKELEYLKKDLVERIMDTKEAFTIEDPITGEEATKESLMKCTIDQLIELMDENVEMLNVVVNGKVVTDGA